MNATHDHQKVSVDLEASGDLRDPLVPSDRVETMLGFPPGKHFVVLPSLPVRAAVGGLALYDATYPHQRLALRVARVFIRCNLGAMLRLRYKPPLPAQNWWLAWLREVAEPILGPVRTAAFRVRGDRSKEPSRITSVLFAHGGEPLAFAKIWRRTTAKRSESGGTSSWRKTIEILDLLGTARTKTFEVPRLLAEGRFRDRYYFIQQVIPLDARQGLPHDPTRLYAIIAEVQSHLEVLERPQDVPSRFVPIHGDITPVNVRIDGNGIVWLVDWDKVGWGPPLADELRYWLADFGRRPGLARRKARRVAALLRCRGTQGQILEALEWRVRLCRVEGEHAEQSLRDALVGLFA